MFRFHSLSQNITLALVLLSSSFASLFAEDAFTGKKSAYHGFERYDFKLEGKDCIVVLPKEVAKGTPWIWRAEFFDHRPEIDVALLGKGFHLVYISVGNTFGCPDALKFWDPPLVHRPRAECPDLSPPDVSPRQCPRLRLRSLLCDGWMT